MSLTVDYTLRTGHLRIDVRGFVSLTLARSACYTAVTRTYRRAHMSEHDFGAYDRYIEQHFDGMVRELREFCSRPTLAGQRVGVEEGVKRVEGLVVACGARARLVTVGG